MSFMRANAKHSAISASATPIRRAFPSTAILLTCISSKIHIAKRYPTTTPSRFATRLNRRSAVSSFSKKNRRHGTGKESRSMRWMASRSRPCTGAIARSLRILFLPQLDLGLGQPDIDRRHVPVAIHVAIALAGLHRAPRATQRDVVALQKLIHVDHVRFGYFAGKVRRDDFASVFEDRHVKLTASGVIANR